MRSPGRTSAAPCSAMARLARTSAAAIASASPSRIAASGSAGPRSAAATIRPSASGQAVAWPAREERGGCCGAVDRYSIGKRAARSGGLNSAVIATLLGVKRNISSPTRCKCPSSAYVPPLRKSTMRRARSCSTPCRLTNTGRRALTKSAPRRASSSDRGSITMISHCRWACRLNTGDRRAVDALSAPSVPSSSTSSAKPRNVMNFSIPPTSPPSCPPLPSLVGCSPESGSDRGLRSPLPEDRPAHPDQGGPLLDRDLKVVRHAHRQFIQFGPLGPQHVTQFAQSAEDRPDFLRVSRQRRDRHQPAQPDRRQRRDVPRRRGHRVRREPVLLRLGGDVHLQQQRNRLSRSFRPPCDLVRQRQRVHRVDQREGVHGAADLVPLEMPHQVPAGPGAQGGDLEQRLLDAVLAEVQDPQGHGLPDALRCNALRHGDETNRLRPPAPPAPPPPHPLVTRGQALRQVVRRPLQRILRGERESWP